MVMAPKCRAWKKGVRSGPKFEAVCLFHGEPGATARVHRAPLCAPRRIVPGPHNRRTIMPVDTLNHAANEAKAAKGAAGNFADHSQRAFTEDQGVHRDRWTRRRGGSALRHGARQGAADDRDPGGPRGWTSAWASAFQPQQVILRRLILALAGAAAFAASAAVFILALAFALYALIEPELGRAGAAAGGCPGQPSGPACHAAPA